MNKLGKSKILSLLRIAKKHIHRCSGQYKVVAIIFKKNKILAIGVNSSTRTYPFLKKLFIHGTLHAEMSALIQILHYDDMKDLDIFIYQESDNKVKKSKPCAMCTQGLYESGFFRNVYWTESDSSISCGKIEDLYQVVMKMDYKSRYEKNGKDKVGVKNV